MSAGTYVVSCDLCKGTGVVRFGTRPPEACHKCAGEGTIIVHGEREDDSMLRAQPSWGDVAWFVIVGIVVAIIGCEIIVWKAGGLWP